jgi:hypothetical protein
VALLAGVCGGLSEIRQTGAEMNPPDIRRMTMLSELHSRNLAGPLEIKELLGLVSQYRHYMAERREVEDERTRRRIFRRFWFRHEEQK